MSRTLARTLSLLEEAQAARQACFSPRDPLVIGDDGPIDNAYLFNNEPARHKLLELIGDLARASGPSALSSPAGHSLNHQLACLLSELR
jgi:UDP-3-O-acyl-N-acetylglucosamine deacetylase